LKHQGGVMDAPAFDARWVRPALRFIAFCFSVVLISTMTMVKPAHASGTVASINTYFAASSGFGFYRYAATPAAACGDGGTQVTGPVVTQISSSQWQCTYTYVNTGTSWDGTNFLMWVYYVSPACPVNSTGTVTCTCTDPYVPDSMGTSCVPAPVSTCTVPPLTELTDPVAIDFDNNPSHRWRPDLLTPVFQEHLTCVENAITARGGSYVGTSAYRPYQYQRHLYEIVKNDGDLNPKYMIAHPECQPLRDEITREMGNDKGPPPGHGLTPGQEVATPGTSRHESGTAFDLTPSGLTAAQLAPIYPGCGVTHKAVRNEPWHTQ
jgi:hypothetical protein